MQSGCSLDAVWMQSANLKHAFELSEIFEILLGEFGSVALEHQREGRVINGGVHLSRRRRTHGMSGVRQRPCALATLVTYAHQVGTPATRAGDAACACGSRADLGGSLTCEPAASERQSALRAFCSTPGASVALYFRTAVATAFW